MRPRSIRALTFLGLRFLFGRPQREGVAGEKRARGRRGPMRAATPGDARGTQLRHSPFWGAVLGISISIIPLYIVIFISNGMIRGITDRYLETKSSHLQAMLPFNPPSQKIQDLLQAISALPGVTSASPEIDGLGLAASSAGSVSAQIRGLDQSIAQDAGYARYVRADSGALYPKSQNETVLGRYLARALRVEVGDSVTLITLRDASGETILPKMSVFRVAGIISTGYRELDANWFIIQYRAALRILNPETSYSFLGIKVADPYGADLDAVRARAVQEMRAVGLAADPDSSVRTWRTTEQGLFQSFTSTRSVLILIMALAVIVAAINLASALTTFVLEHRLEIAILKSYGLSRSQAATIFLIGGTATGTLGILAGSAVGIFISMYINQIIAGFQFLLDFFTHMLAPAAHSIALLNPDYYLEHIPINFSWTFPLITVGVSVLASALVSIIPALKSASIAPSELIRHE